MIKFLTPFFLIGILILNTQCGPTIKITENDKDQLDPDFAGFSGTLLVLRNYDNKRRYNGYDKMTIKAFEKYYKGDFKIISKKDLSKYSDLDKYRFFVECGVSAHYDGSFNGRANYSHKTWYYMMNRKTQKGYETKHYPGYVAMEEYPLALEALRTSKPKVQ